MPITRLLHCAVRTSHLTRHIINDSSGMRETALIRTHAHACTHTNLANTKQLVLLIDEPNIKLGVVNNATASMRNWPTHESWTGTATFHVLSI